MRFALLAPGMLVGAVAAALGVLALHFLAIGRPPRRLLPTARFVPPSTAVASSLTRRPTDRALLALRTLALLLAGLALAGPVLLPARRAVVRVILADRSRGVLDAGEVARRTRALAREGDVVIAFDSAPSRAVVVDAGAGSRAALDTLFAARPRSDAWWRGARGALSAALVAAVRAGGELRERADSVELVLVSPLAAEEADAATRRIRALWPGRARVERVAAVGSVPVRGGVEVRDAAGRVASIDDPIAAAVALLGGATRDDSSARVRSAVRVVRAATVGAADSTWLATATVAAPRVLVIWPRDGAPAGWRRLARPDSLASALEAAGAVAIAPFARTATRGPAADTSRDAHVVARWADGEPAAVERARGAGCVREVGVGVPEAGDATLSTPFRAVLAALVAPCGAPFAVAPSDELARLLAGGGALAPAGAFAAASVRQDARWTRWLLAASIALLLVEMLVRRRRDHAVATESATASTAKRREAA